MIVESLKSFLQTISLTTVSARLLMIGCLLAAAHTTIISAACQSGSGGFLDADVIDVSNPAAPSYELGFRWPQAGGRVSVDTWLHRQSVHLASNTTLSGPGDCPGGNVVVGQTQDDSGCVAHGATTVTVPGSVTTLPDCFLIAT